MKIIGKEKYVVSEEQLERSNFDVYAEIQSLLNESNRRKDSAIVEWLGADDENEAKKLLESLKLNGFEVSLKEGPFEINAHYDVDLCLYVCSVRQTFYIRLINATKGVEK